MSMCYQDFFFFFKYFALIGTQKVPRTVLMGVSVLDSLTFSPEKK